MRKLIITSKEVIKEDNRDLIQTVEVQNYNGEDYYVNLFHDLTSALAAMVIEHIKPEAVEGTVDLITRQLRSSMKRAAEGDVITHTGDANVPAEVQILNGIIGLHNRTKGVQ